MTLPLVLVGGGNMGGALLRGWLAKNIPWHEIYVVEPDPERAADLPSGSGEHTVHVVAAAAELPDSLQPAVVVMAIKPQVLETALAAYRPFAEAGALILTIAAGKTMASVGKVVGEGAAIVRALPNTPAAIGRGISVACPGPGMTDEHRALCQQLLAAVGEVVWVEDEALLDPVTAVSGSGPAYVFLLVECLAEAARKAGLEPELADQLARATVAGAGELVARSEQTAEALRQAVTSPGGTTEAGLEVLMGSDGLESLMVRAVAAATARSRELAR